MFVSAIARKLRCCRPVKEWRHVLDCLIDAQADYEDSGSRGRHTCCCSSRPFPWRHKGTENKSIKSEFIIKDPSMFIWWGIGLIQPSSFESLLTRVLSTWSTLVQQWAVPWPGECLSHFVWNFWMWCYSKPPFQGPRSAGCTLGGYLQVEDPNMTVKIL